MTEDRFDGGVDNALHIIHLGVGIFDKEVSAVGVIMGDFMALVSNSMTIVDAGFYAFLFAAAVVHRLPIARCRPPLGAVLSAVEEYRQYFQSK